MPISSFQIKLKNQIKIALIFAFLASAFSSCAKRADEVPPLPAVSEKPLVLEGSLAENVAKVQSRQNRGACENEFREGQFEVARALDARAAEIAAFTKQRAEASGTQYRRLSLGSLTVRQPISLRAPNPGWKSYTTGWKIVLEDYAALKGSRVDSRWVQLNSDAQSLIWEDVSRVVQMQNPYLDKNAGPKLERLARVIQICGGRPDCGTVAFSAELEDFLANQPNYRAYQRSIANKETLEEKRRMIQRFLRYVRGDLSGYQFQTNPRMERVGAGRYSLQVDPGALADGQDQLKNIVESVWRSPQEQVSLKWKDARTFQDLYRIVVGTTTGSRSYVVREEKTLMLFPDVRANSIAHEFGHLMGFTDRYFTVWHPEACEYRIQNSAEDIMSDSTAGIVLPEHWEELSRHY